MTKGKAPKEIRERRKDGKKRHGWGVADSSLSTRMWNLFVAFTIVAGVMGTYFFFRPTVEIETPSSNPSDAYELFSRPFVIKNNSPWFSVRDVHVLCQVNRIWRGSPLAPSLEENNAAADYVPPVQVLNAGEQYSIPCATLIESSKPIRRAEVIIVFDYYRPWFYLGHTVTQQGYRAIIGGDGRGYWTPYVLGQ